MFEFDDFFGDEFCEEDMVKDGCDAFCLGDGIEVFALVGGAIGYLEEEITERRRLER